MSKKAKATIKQAWSDADRQRFADKNILRSKVIASKRKPVPTVDEWDA